MLLKYNVNNHNVVMYCSGAPNRGLGGGVATPPLNFGGGAVEHLSTPPDLEKIFIMGVGSP